MNLDQKDQCFYGTQLVYSMERVKMTFALIINKIKDKRFTQMEDLFISHAHSNNVSCCSDLGQATKNKVNKR